MGCNYNLLETMPVMGNYGGPQSESMDAGGVDAPAYMFKKEAVLAHVVRSPLPMASWLVKTKLTCLLHYQPMMLLLTVVTINKKT